MARMRDVAPTTCGISGRKVASKMADDGDEVRQETLVSKALAEQRAKICGQSKL